MFSSGFLANLGAVTALAGPGTLVVSDQVNHASIVDAGALKVEGDNAILYLWYDNEFGYSCQVVRVVQHVSGVEYPTYPAPAV